MKRQKRKSGVITRGQEGAGFRTVFGLLRSVVKHGRCKKSAQSLWGEVCHSTALMGENLTVLQCRFYWADNEIRQNRKLSLAHKTPAPISWLQWCIKSANSNGFILATLLLLLQPPQKLSFSSSVSDFTCHTYCHWCSAPNPRDLCCW